MAREVKGKCPACGWVGPDRGMTKDPTLFADSDYRYHRNEHCPKNPNSTYNYGKKAKASTKRKR